MPNRTVSQFPNGPTPVEIAERMTQLGAHVIFLPFGQKGANTSGWQDLATNNFEIAKSRVNGERMNVGVVGKRDGLWFFDDDENVLGEYEAQHGPILTYGTRTVSGGKHLFFRQNEASWTMGNISGKNDQGEETWSARVKDKYVLSPWSAAYPNNDTSLPLTYYEAIDKNLPVIEAPDTFIAFLKEKHERNPRVVKESGNVRATADSKIVEGGRNNYLTSMAGSWRQKYGWGEDRLLVNLRLENEEKCVPPLPDAELRTIAGSIANYEVKDTRFFVRG